MFHGYYKVRFKSKTPNKKKAASKPSIANIEGCLVFTPQCT